MKPFFHSNIKILSKSIVGYVGVCSCCGEIQFSVGNIISHIPEKGFLNLLQALRSLSLEVEKHITLMPDGERLLLKTPVDEFLLSLSEEEFYQVLDLFEQASLMVEVNQILSH